VNRLAIERRASVIAALVEGASINATCRMTGVAKHTVLKLLKDVGCAAASFHDVHAAISACAVSSAMKYGPSSGRR
jgi:hypothetical protein